MIQIIEKHQAEFVKKILFIYLFTLATIGASVMAQIPQLITSDKSGWHKIGETKADFIRDRDEISVMGANRFAQIKFKVEEQSIYITSIEVYYESGDKQDIAIDLPLKAPEESRIIDLNGGERNVKKIVFVYKSISNEKGKKAHVEIYGLKTNK